MNQFLIAHSAGRSGNELLNDCVKQLGDIPPEATFGFLYLSDHLSEQVDFLLNQLKHLTNITNWVGSLGMGIIATQTEYYDQPAMAIMIADFNEADFYMLPNFTEDTAPLSGKLASWCKANDFNVGLVHADPENQHTQTLLHQLGEDIPAAFLVGGITSSRGHNIQFANQVLHGGISGVLFSQDVAIKTNLTQGCTPISSRHRVTQSEKNIAYTLDHRPALDVLNEAAGEIISENWEHNSGYIFAGLVNQNSDIDDYSVQQLIGVDTENKLVAIGDYLHNEQEIIFCRRDGNSALEDMKRMLTELKSRLSSPIKGGIYISCLGRGKEQFGEHSEEVRFIHSVLGEFPLTGFFANGEIHKNTLYGFTGVLILFV